jgi:hypothetical protein
MSEGKNTINGVYRLLFQVSNGLMKKKTVPGLHSERRRDMGAPFHSSNTIRRNAADTLKCSDGEKIPSVSI